MPEATVLILLIATLFAGPQEVSLVYNTEVECGIAYADYRQREGEWIEAAMGQGRLIRVLACQPYSYGHLTIP